MKKEYEILFTGAKIGTCEVKNRFVMCPMEGTTMVEWLNGNGYDPAVHDLFIDKAKDGVGLIIPGAVPVASFNGHQWLWQHPEAFTGVKETVDELHSYGTKIFFQLTAGFGRNTPMPYEMFNQYEKLNPVLNLDAVNASADDGMPNIWINEFKTKALKKDQIHDIIHAMAETAFLCKEAGIDGIDIHAVHEGYLLDQFACTYTNHRSDEYGGSLENRLRFSCEIVKAIKERCGQDYPVMLRYSVTSKTRGFNKGIIPADHESEEIGRDMEESKKAIQILTEAGYDAFNADNGTYDAWYYAHPPVYMPLNCNLAEVKEISKYTDKPLICAGRMQLEDAAREIKNGNIDFVGIARQFLTETDYLTKIREEREDDIMPCIGCHLGCLPNGLWKKSGLVMNMNEPTGVCALNPYTRNEKKYAVKMASNPKRIAVIGAGIAGMEFALQAAKRGHAVTLYEKSDRFGGVFNEAASFTFKEKDRELIQYYIRQIGKSNVRVQLNTEVRDLSEIEADEIVIATGSSCARNLRIPGNDKAVTALDFLRNKMECGDHVAIIGGGLTGCEIAYELAMSGKHPAIVEMQDDILKVVGSSMANTSYLRDAFEYYKVPVYTSTKTLSIDNNCLNIQLEDGEYKTILCDDVVVSIGYDSGCRLAESESDHVHFIGDVYKVANLKNAIWRANDLVLELSK